MAAVDPFTIKYISRQVGGSTAYRLHGPYVIDKSHDTFRLVFEVVVVGTSHASLQGLSEALEDDFSKRMADGDSLTISLNGSTWTYAMGTTLLKATASLAKSGNPETDRGFSRAYLCTIEGELPADDALDAGLRDIEVLVDYEPSRQRTVTMRGTYTATTAGNAKARYDSAFAAVAVDYLDAIDNSATWQIVDETGAFDRERTSSGTPAPHLWNFTQQYVEVLFKQTTANLTPGVDGSDIKDHRITFTALDSFPGDGDENARRLQRVIASYDCALDVTQATDLDAAYQNDVKPHVLELFKQNFNPKVFGVEERRRSYDETSKRMSTTVQFIYQPQEGEAIVEVAQSVAFRESRNIDYTPVHDEDEFAAIADPGWATLERVWNRTVIAVGDESPKTRIAEPARSHDAGPFDDNIGGHVGPDARFTSTKVNESGWNIVQNTSQVSDQWLGDPSGDQQIKVSVLTETVVERYHRKPGGGAGQAIQKSP